mgnify:CR=1 FL=1|tara:strand:+ start:220 stop:573 length:354 start_codon:yes stop_codon:yes gene_type:complete
MKTGFAIIIGKVIDMIPDSFTGRNGDDVKKLSVLVKPSDEASPIELEVWGDLADKFQNGDTISQHVVIQAGVVGREWEKEGRTYRRTSLRIKEWSIVGQDTPTETNTVAAGAEDFPF